MQLEDGRFLMSAERYDKLLQVSAEHSSTLSIRERLFTLEMKKINLIIVLKMITQICGCGL